MFRRVRRLLGQRREIILAYHSFSNEYRYLDMAVPKDLFFEQVKYLCTVFTVQSLSRALEDQAYQSGIQRDLAVITVDDGYADNFQPLIDVAERFGALSTVYLTTSCIDFREPTTIMWIMMAVHHANQLSISIPEIGLEPLSISGRVEKEVAIRQIDRCLRPLSTKERRELIDLLLDRSGAAPTIRHLAKSVMLNWDEVKFMQGIGIEFGAHTLTHPVLSHLEPKAVRDEIIRSSDRVREVTGANTVTVAYPYGSDAEVNDAVVEICRTSGASAAVTLVEGEMSGDLFRIPRIMVTSDMSSNPWGGFSKAVWACELAGLTTLPRRIFTSIEKAVKFGLGLVR